MAMDIEKICRTCLGLNGPLLSIYENDDGGEGCIADMLRDFTKTKPRQDDKLPEVVCLPCISEINRCYSFKIKCENSCRTLRQLLSNDFPEESSEPQKGKVLQCNKSVQTQPEFTKLLKTVSTQTKVILEPERNALEVKTSPQRSTTPLLFEEPKSQKLHEIKLKKSLDETKTEETEITETAAVGNIQGLSIEDFDLSDSEADTVIIKFEAEDDEINEVVPEIKIYLPDHAGQGEEPNENVITHQLDTEQQSKNESENENILIHPQSKNSEIIYQVNAGKGDTKIKVHSNSPSAPFITPQPIKVQSKTVKLPHFCQSCGAGFALRSSLARHTKEDICNKGNFKCNKCDRTFISLETLKEHMDTHLLDNLCAECGLCLPTSDELGQHMIKFHRRDPRNQCPICKKVFTILSGLKDHLRVHSGEKPFMCTICQKGFTQRANLNQHLKRHSKKKNFKCSDCEKSFVTKAELCSHQRTHTGEHPFRCDECLATFTTSSALAKHKRIHTGERPYACDFCPKCFSSLNALKNHRRIHTGERPYKCRYCSKRFTQRQDCITHHRTHTGERKYACFCGETFKHSPTLRNHINKMHDGADSGTAVAVASIVGGKRHSSSTLSGNDATKKLQRRDSDAYDDNNDDTDEATVKADAEEDVICDQKPTIVKVECEETIS